MEIRKHITPFYKIRSMSRHTQLLKGKSYLQG